MTRVVRLYAHLIAPINQGEAVQIQHFKAINMCCNVAESLCRMFNGIGECSSCGIVQYTDTIRFENISDNSMAFILECHPFIREINKSFKFYLE